MSSRFDIARNTTEARARATHVNVPSRCGEGTDSEPYYVVYTSSD